MVRGCRTFKELPESGEGIASNILTDRLRTLQANGIVTLENEKNDGRKVNYRLTGKGIDLSSVAGQPASRAGGFRRRTYFYHRGDCGRLTLWSKAGLAPAPLPMFGRRPAMDCSNAREPVYARRGMLSDISPPPILTGPERWSGEQEQTEGAVSFPRLLRSGLRSCHP